MPARFDLRASDGFGPLLHSPAPMPVIGCFHGLALWRSVSAKPVEHRQSPTQTEQARVDASQDARRDLP
jgi:hypothetical protein